MRMLRHVLRTYNKKEPRRWDTIYWAVDIHDTCIVANYNGNEVPKEFFPMAKETLFRLSERKDTKLILYTCSYPEEIAQYVSFFKDHQIHFDYANENPEAGNTAYGFFEHKPYFQILLEDKAGFEPNTDFYEISLALDIIEAAESGKSTLGLNEILADKRFSFNQVDYDDVRAWLGLP